MKIQTFTPIAITTALLVVCAQSMDSRVARSVAKVRCPDSEVLMITRAFFERGAALQNRCAANCSSIRGSPSPSVCENKKRILGLLFRDRCRAFFTDKELNDIYEALDSGSPAKIDKLKKTFALLGSYTIHYTCLRKGPEMVDPCAKEEAEQWQDRQFTSILVAPQRLRQQQQCIKVCTLTPAGHFRITLNVLFKEGKKQKKHNSLEYQFVSRFGRDFVKSSWTTLKNRTDLLIGVTEFNIRFHLQDLSAVTRLWISLVGEPREFSFSCQSNTTQSHPGKDEDVDHLNWAHILAAVCGCLGLVIIVILTAVAFIRYRSHRHVAAKTMHNGMSSGAVTPWRINTAHSTQSEEEVYIELDDAAHDDDNATTSVMPDSLPTGRIAVAGDTTETSLVESQAMFSGHSSGCFHHTQCQQGSTDSTVYSSADCFHTQCQQALTDSTAYSTPHIYMNTSEHPYNIFRSSSQIQDKSSTLYTDAYSAPKMDKL